MLTSPIDGKDYPIHIDFLCDKCDLGYHFRVQPDLEAFMFEGADIAFDFNFEKEIEAVLPGNGRDSMIFRVLNLTGSMILKGQALGGRRNLKDAYDIFALTHYGGSPEAAARYFNENFNEAKISRDRKSFALGSLATIRKKFQDDTTSGPFSIETFTEEKYKRTIVRVQVKKFLDNLDLSG